ncbi:DNA cytosine methyltransferase [Desmospora activa]|uniref:Cytosine-specific methyltransferase n=1 Tax=Desmospora activa DSM 45169 TaxID=1121389 RepID=A0A2T4Z913_9BACL|nr:DNA cytosine methyltransferase [Desmospora activa]PTM58369.1 DNA (cytosine-5)-methyltransferase 1 [Desmospora activa DSM 45169]
MSSRFKVISTFAGCGGSSLGYRLAAGKILLAVEWDDNAVATYKLNHPETDVFHGDVSKLSVDECLSRTGLSPGELDIFDGSPPCQGFSTAGKRDFGDQRNQLFHEYVRLLRGLKPKVFVMENVAGMVKGKMKLLFAEILRELKACGYKVSARKLNAMYFGVPQNRERIIFVGVRDDLGIDPSHPKPQTRPVSVKEAFKGLPIDKTRTLKDIGYHLWQRLEPGQSFDKVHPKKHWFNAIKVDPHKPCNTVTKTVFVTGSSGLYHWEYPRVLSIAELKRVASFPDDYQFAGDFKDQWARIGNCVPPLMMKAVAEHIHKNILER